MDFWIIFFLLAAVCVLFGVFTVKSAPGIKPSIPHPPVEQEADPDMRTKPKVEIVPRPPDVVNVPDVFHEDRFRRDLAKFARTPGLFAKYVERARSRFTKAGERAILEHWIAFYQTGQRVIEARTAMERQTSEFLQLGREHEVKEAQKGADLAKQQADTEEHLLRRDQAAYRRQHPEIFIEGAQPPKPEPPQLSPDQQRRLKRMEIEDRLEELKKEEAKALQKTTSELEKRRIQNMYASRRDQLMEQQEKYL